MIQSDIITPDATDFLNQIDQQKAQTAAQDARLMASVKLLDHCNKWFDKAWQWRKQSYEPSWLVYQRNSDGIFDPSLAKRKEAWQSKAFWDMTATHRESIQGAIFKLVMGARPILEVQPRFSGDEDMATSIRDITIREFDKSRFEIAYNSVLEDSTTFGSGFCRITWEERVEDRLVRQNVFEPINVNDQQNLARHAMGQPQTIGFQESIQPQLIYRGVKIEHIPIWDFFPDPKALCIKDNPCAFRFRVTYQDILDGVTRGYYLQEAAVRLKNVTPDETEPQEKLSVNMNRGIADAMVERTENDRRFELKEYYAKLPQKWVFPLLTQPQQVTDPDRLIAARVIFHKDIICAVELNKDYDGWAPYEKLDYFGVTGRFYARGVCEMLKDKQQITNEVVNQRLDNGALALNKGWMVVEKALVDSRDLTSKPGMVVRINNKSLGPDGDVRNVIQPMDMGSIDLRSGFSEVYEQERSAAERTGANRTTLGTAGLVNDSNHTLGGQELAKESASGKMSYIGMMQEFSWFKGVVERYWKLIYQNIQPEDVMAAIGPDRMQTFRLMSPIEVSTQYKFEPQGIFEMENRAQIQAQVQSIVQQFMGMPEIDPVKVFDFLMKNANIDPTLLKRTPQEMYQFLMAQGLMQTPHPRNGPTAPGQAPDSSANGITANVNVNPRNGQ